MNDNGYLRAKLSDIVELAMPDYVINRTDVQAMIGVLQDFEPVGVGARTASECLLIQLREKAIETPGLALARQISKHYLHLLASQKTEEIAAKLKLKGDELKTALALIRTLNPFPGSVIAREAPRLITPDLVVKKMGERWVVRLNPNVAPSINMHSESDGLLELARGKKGYENLKQEWQKAQTLLSNLEKRYRTLIHVATIIVDRQND
ncbi:MAG: hypothetical protein KAG66_02640, partial [Methylococcales bacterium]|nr:hypothetical protein [Methylococcales bacterium]